MAMFRPLRTKNQGPLSFRLGPRYPAPPGTQPGMDRLNSGAQPARHELTTQNATVQPPGAVKVPLSGAPMWTCEPAHQTYTDFQMLP